MTIKECIKGIMKKDRITQQMLADRLNKTQPEAYTIINGDMRVSTLMKVLQALQYDIVVVPSVNGGDVLMERKKCDECYYKQFAKEFINMSERIAEEMNKG